MEPKNLKQKIEAEKKRLEKHLETEGDMLSRSYSYKSGRLAGIMLVEKWLEEEGDTPAHPVNQWVKASERLPELEQEVFVKYTYEGMLYKSVAAFVNDTGAGVRLRFDDDSGILLDGFSPEIYWLDESSSLKQEESVLPSDNLQEDWFEENRRFATWFLSSGLNPHTTSYEDALKQWKESGLQASPTKKEEGEREEFPREETTTRNND